MYPAAPEQEAGHLGDGLVPTLGWPHQLVEAQWHGDGEGLLYVIASGKEERLFRVHGGVSPL